jgi:ribonucleotide reductase beta subunit family protein with ferritin-like domain
MVPSDLQDVFQKYSMVEIIEAYQENNQTTSSVSKRLGLFPITDSHTFDLALKQLANFWLPSETGYDNDRVSMPQLTEEERQLLLRTLAIFSFQDGDIIESTLLGTIMEAPTLEEKFFGIIKAWIEAIHAWAYSELIDKLVVHPEQRLQLQQAVEQMEFLRAKQALNQKYKSNKYSREERSAVTAILEGVGFAVLFAVIFSFKERPHPLNFDGLFFNNHKIAEDEFLHRTKEVEWLRGRITRDKFLEILLEFVHVEEMCVDELLPTHTSVLTNQSLKEYLYYTADRLLIDLGFEAYWKVENSLPFMDKIGLTGQTNFFERKVTEYSQTVTAVPETDDW